MLPRALKAHQKVLADIGEPRPVKRWKSKEPQNSSKKVDSDWRIMSINVNNFPTETNGLEKAKIDTVKQFMVSSETDIFGIIELGKNENNIPEKARPSKVVKKWFENCVATPAWNERNNDSSFEPGGVMNITKDRSSAHAIKRGKDEKRLGRWAWVTIKGKQEKITTVVTAYRAVNTQVTAQNQLGHIRQRNVSIQPEEYWENDLASLIAEKKEAGQVIVIDDFNCDLNEKGSKVNRFFEQQGMREVLIEKYGKGPPTYNFGKNTIDGIYATEGITIRQGGYGGADEAPGDHLCPWVDISENELIGSARDDRPPPILRKTTSRIPSVRKSFNKIVNDEVEKHRLHEKTEELIKAARTNKALTKDQARDYEMIEKRLRRAVKYGDSKCRKARVGNVPFSKKQKELMGRLSVLKLIRTRHVMKGRAGRPRTRKLRRMIKKYAFQGKSQFDSIEAINKEIEEAAHAYNMFRPKSMEYR